MCLESLERFNVPEIEEWRGYEKESASVSLKGNHLREETLNTNDAATFVDSK